MKYQKWNDNLKDRKVKCISAVSGSGLIVGDIYYAKNRSGASYAKMTVSSTKNGPVTGGWGYMHEFDFLEPSKEELLIELSEAEEQVKNIKMQIQFIDENGLDNYSEELFKAYRIMKVMNLGDLEKAKEVVKILNS